MNVFYWDWEFTWLYALQGIHNPILDVIMAFVSNLGNAGALWVVLSIVFMIPKKTRKTGIQMFVTIAITYIVGNLILKNLVARARPCQIPPHDQVALLVKIPTDYSFPSGHSMNGFTASVALLCCDKRFGIPAVILAAVIAFSRLYNFVHFPTDVIVGGLIGIIIALFVDCLFSKKGWKYTA